MKTSTWTKRVAAIVTCFVLLGMLLAGCGGAASSSSAAVSSGVASQPAGTTAPEEPQVVVVDPYKYREDSDDYIQKYLAHYFGLSLGGGLTQGDFVAALDAIKPAGRTAELEADQYDAGAALTGLDAVRLAVVYANMEELALVFEAEKTQAILEAAGYAGVDDDYAPYLACALDVQLVTPEMADALVANGEVSDSLAARLVFKAANINGTGRHYLGYSDDPEIFLEITNAMSRFILFDYEELSNAGAQAVANEVTTGFNLKYRKYSANFLPELTIMYSHTSTKHVRQLFGLLSSEGIVVRAQLEPKVSIYEYSSPEQASLGLTATGGNRDVDGTILSYWTEFDLKLEFMSQQDLEKFDGLINAYAKRNSDEEGKALLSGAWWVPLYSTTFEPGGEAAENQGYMEIVDNVIVVGDYELHTFSLPDQVDAIRADFLSSNPDFDVTVQPIWVNAAFFRYQNGENE